MKTALAFALAAVALASQASAQQSVAIATGRAHSVATLTAAMGQSVRLNRWTFTPVKVLEDSRCPRMVACVWRGRLKVEFAMRGGPPVILEDNKPVRFGGGTLTLLGAQPLSQHGEKIPPQAYRFQLRYERR